MTKIESGRSMVEMLGVLAIIGVLSIGGIAGYTMAMNRYRANEILDAASKMSVIAQTRGDGMSGNNATVTLDDIGITADNIHGATFTVSQNGQVSVAGASNGVKSALKSITGNDTVIINAAN